jgi:hypothetical protein
MVLKQLRQTGFSILECTIIIGIAAVIIIVGCLVYVKNGQNSTTPLPTGLATTLTQANDKTYVASNNDFTLLYPSNWNISSLRVPTSEPAQDNLAPTFTPPQAPTLYGGYPDQVVVTG